MRQVSLPVLEDKIIRPGFEKHLKPLVMYRGAVTLGQAHRMWNLIVSGMEHEASLADLNRRLQLNPEYSHLCGPDKHKASTTIYGFLSRLEDNPKVLGEMSGLAGYVDWLGGWRPSLTPVDANTYRRRNMGAGGWRSYTGTEGPHGAPRTKDIVYPFLIHDGGKPEHDLLRRVSAAVPKYLEADLRADICQDIIVGILCGDFDEDNLTLPAKEMTRRVQAMFPTKYGPLSLDAIIEGTDGLTILDKLTEEDTLWNAI